MVHHYLSYLKGHWTTSALSPFFFFKKVEIFIPLEVYTYVATVCLILLATSTNYEDKQIFLAAAIFKSLLSKMAATAMTVEFGTIYHFSSLEENSKVYLCSSLKSNKN